MTFREAAGEGGPLSEYLNPKSAITMGACAAMVLAFTTSLCGAFACLPAAIVALALSCMFGWAQVAYLDEKAPMKVFYAMVCALIIFNAARGGNLAITDATGGSVVVPPAVLNLGTNATPHASSGGGFIVPSAYAGGEPVTDKVKPGKDKFYYRSTTADGNPVYTNVYGKVHTNMAFKAERSRAQKRVFKEWTWGSREAAK